ncbi:ABC transporter ATP-binding protein [Agrobacterium tumefaciens]|uniref:ABC transporter ATP-binding protein n=1 Tax=Agrobacterium tumefaciens TaxID=358 RepID=UPI001574257C|nr:ABC transporter ATP-binding protein [Agrobacterium tumefaciens]NTE68235.1 ABC transporter ATP-binding protein [Agrobacterium tumefaciens]
MTSLLEFVNFGLRLAHGLTLTQTVSLRIGAGEIVGLVGESGSGKSVTARSALGLKPAGSQTVGKVLFEGRDICTMPEPELNAVRRHGAAIIFQNPRSALDPVRTIGHFLTETLIRHDGVSRREAASRAIAAMADVGISHPERRMNQYPHELSGGMLQRVAICAAVLSGARLLLADEATTALDVTTQAEVVGLLQRLRDQRGIGALFITHDLELAKATCSRIYVMYAGRIMEELATRNFDEDAAHPYTRALLAARPSLERRVARLAAIPGFPPTASGVSNRCAFASRCSCSIPECVAGEPGLQQVTHDHWVRCVRARDFAPVGGE